MIFLFDNVTTDMGLKDFSLQIDLDKCTVLKDHLEETSAAVLRVIAGLERITSGHLYLNGQSIAEYLQDRPMPAVIGYVFDEGIMLSNLSIRENLMLPCRMYLPGFSEPECLQQAVQWLQRYGLDTDLELRPAALRPSRLKFLAYLRGYLLKPEVLLIDDPFYQLNKGERAVMMNILTDLKGTFRLLISSTDDEFAGDFTEQCLDLGTQ